MQHIRLEGLRPLSLVNTLNRLMANAYTLRIEPILERVVSVNQRGFLPGRSMLASVDEVDTAMHKISLSHQNLGAVLL